MQTIKTISNIAYNTIDHFEGVIMDLLQRGVIEWAYWISHEPDKDELKPHVHFVLKPSRRLDTAVLRKEFLEYDPRNPLPLCCTMKWNFTNSMDDWLLYVVHDPAYLVSKGQLRNITYSFEDLRATDYDALRMDWNAIDRTKFERLHFLEKAIEENTPFSVLVQQGIIPISQRAQYEAQYRALWYDKYNREYSSSWRKEDHEKAYAEQMATIDLSDIEDMEKYIKEHQIPMKDIDVSER